MSRIAARTAVCALLTVWLAGAADNGPAGNDSLASLSMEELTNLTVSSVSRRDQRLSRVAAAVYIITDEDIRRSGLSSIPELLRRVPGLSVARLDSNKWAVSSRGFNGRFANKMLVLIDGRSVYNNAYSGVYWDQNDVLLEDVERIEVIRGPGATMWGANAVNGVINIITKKAKATHGGLVVANTGGDELGAGSVRYGAGDNGHLDYRGYAKYFDRRPLLGANGLAPHDGWDSLRGGGRLDWQPTSADSLSFSGDVYRGHSDQLINQTFETPFATIGKDTAQFSGGFAMGRWERTLRNSDIAVQTYYNDERRKEWLGSGYLKTVDFDFQQHFYWNQAHDVVWGAGYRSLNDRVAPSGGLNLLGQPNPAPFSPASRHDQLYSAFMQDDWSIVPDRFVLTLGTKILHNSYTGIEVQPGVRMMWTPTVHESIWASVARAVRTPSQRDVDSNIHMPLPPMGPVPVEILLTGNKHFQSERMIAYEAGYRRQFGRNVSLDVAGFFNKYDNLESNVQLAPYVAQSPQPVLVIPIADVNAGFGHTYGIETSLRWNVNHRWHVEAGHAWMSARLQGPDLSPVLSFQSWTWLTPRNTFSVNTGYDLTRRLKLDGALYFVSHLPERSIPAYTRADVRLAWKVGEYLELSSGVQNLGTPSHVEFSIEEYTMNSAVRRSAYLQATWRF